MLNLPWPLRWLTRSNSPESSGSFITALGATALVTGLCFGCDSTVKGTMSTIESAQPSTGGTGAADTVAGTGMIPETIPSDIPLGGGGSGTAEEPVEPLVDLCPDVSKVCTPVHSSEPLPGRVLPDIQSTVTHTVTAQDIYEAFETACGKCHKGEARQNNGGFFLNSAQEMVADLDERVGQPAIERLLANDPHKVMPPVRAATTGVEPMRADDQALLELMQEWLAAGRSSDGFTTTADAQPPFLREESIRTQLSNIGNCIPEPAMVGCAQPEMARLDAKFAAMKSFDDLPKRLDETDMVTFDTATLAQQRVIPYAPTYTLFSDNAKKMRHVRVPLGQKIHYDPELKDFVIPPNTRFYKTFLREVIDKEGHHSYRKIETRIILVRPDIDVGGVKTRQVIFGTYLWSLDEAYAELEERRYNDQTPFRDVLLRHVTDEARAEARGIDPDTEGGINAALAVDDGLRSEHPHTSYDSSTLLTRGYAVPGRDRCIQCHMGSSTYTGGPDSRSFILGFNPYQVDRRTKQDGGVFDSVETQTGPDELTQLRRFIDYGLIDGVTLPVPAADTTSTAATDQAVFKLEESQEVAPRNSYELKAQGYMMGNCAFCHNPRGFPSIENPSLKEVLNFFPDQTSDGGIFHFPLERYSPRTSRGANFEARFPYITPSLFERADSVGQNLAAEKSFTLFGSPIVTVYVAGPWRSLIYRNTHTPFTYGHDQAIHPHMPLNVPGYDLRVSNILGDWMLSIPARLKPALKKEVRGEEPVIVRPAAENRQDFLGQAPSLDDPVGSEQPWEEVTPDDPLYPQYQQAAELRVKTFHLSSVMPSEVYASFCPSGVEQDCEDDIAEAHAFIGSSSFHPDASDVVAPEMRLPPQLEAPYDEPFWILPGSAGDADAGAGDAQIVRDRNDLAEADRTRSGGAYYDVVPDRPSWVPRDLTIPPGAWVPRRPQWADIFSSEEKFLPEPIDLSDLDSAAREAKRQELEALRTKAKRVYGLLTDFKITPELRDFALSKDFALGLWASPPLGAANPAERDRCNAVLGPGSAPKRLHDFKDHPPLWFNELGIEAATVATKPADDHLVYVQPPGEVLFTLICSNCHGSEANANSLLASTMLELTGGRTRVANLRDGLFGGAGENRELVFPGPQYPNETSETMAVRYLLWMGLGGTQATIPQVVLNRVGATRPLGVDRGANPNAQPTANMLSNAIGFCQDSIGLHLAFDQSRRQVRFDSRKEGLSGYFPESPLVASNGDLDLWLSLCGLNNPPPIRVVEYQPPPPDGGVPSSFSLQVTSAYWADLDGTSMLPAKVHIGDQHGRVVEGLKPDNTLPWCVKKPTAAIQATLEDAWVHDPNFDVPRKIDNIDIPYCPDELFTGATYQDSRNNLNWLQVQELKDADERRDRWATRGAMNVGASVFLYLDAVSKSTLTRKPAYDACALPEGTQK